jgi:hypothetical protein
LLGFIDKLPDRGNKLHLNKLKMKNIRKIGIWMDHSTAYLIELKDDSIEEIIIKSETPHPENKTGFRQNEKLVHIKEQHQESSYYKKLSDNIINYQEVVLFGPTEAKTELLNLLKADHLFENIKIAVKQSDKMTTNQMHAFVRSYFN